MTAQTRRIQIRGFASDTAAVLAWWKQQHTSSGAGPLADLDQLPNVDTLCIVVIDTDPLTAYILWRTSTEPLFICGTEAESLRFVARTPVAEARFDLALVAMRKLARRANRPAHIRIDAFSEEYTVLPSGAIQKRSIEPKSTPSSEETRP